LVITAVAAVACSQKNKKSDDATGSGATGAGALAGVTVTLAPPRDFKRPICEQPASISAASSAAGSVRTRVDLMELNLRW
jgi:hypothetical protein